jgi:pyruvate formate lyase activating enzyme
MSNETMRKDKMSSPFYRRTRRKKASAARRDGGRSGDGARETGARSAQGAGGPSADAYPVIECGLCPHGCRLAHGQAGDCRIRINYRGKLYAVTYGRPCALHLDPIEKKPLFHVLPGTQILSLATAGCNLHCRNCQNAAISQADPQDVRIQSWSRREYGLSPQRLVELCERRAVPSLAYTYTEPVVYYEYTYETAVRAREKGIKNIAVTAAYINERPLRRLCKVIDAANVDLKTMNPAFFRKNCGGELKHVLDALVVARSEGVWLEITNLVIPTLNDSAQETRKLCKWIYAHLGADTPLHFSRFYPHHQLRNLAPTSLHTLRRARQTALDAGLRYVYVGNVRGQEFEHTYCPSCKAKVIGRVGYAITRMAVKDGRCVRCGHEIAGVWK